MHRTLVWTCLHLVHIEHLYFCICPFLYFFVYCIFEGTREVVAASCHLPQNVPPQAKYKPPLNASDIKFYIYLSDIRETEKCYQAWETWVAINGTCLSKKSDFEFAILHSRHHRKMRAFLATWGSACQDTQTGNRSKFATRWTPGWLCHSFVYLYLCTRKPTPFAKLKVSKGIMRSPHMSTLWTYVLRVYTIYLQIDCVVLSRSLSLKPVYFCIFVFLYFCILSQPPAVSCPARQSHHLRPSSISTFFTHLERTWSIFFNVFLPIFTTVPPSIINLHLFHPSSTRNPDILFKDFKNPSFFWRLEFRIVSISHQGLHLASHSW